MNNVTQYSELRSKIPLKNLLRIHRNLTLIGEAGEQTILSSLKTMSLNIFDADYQIPVKNEEDFRLLKMILSDLASNLFHNLAI